MGDHLSYDDVARQIIRKEIEAALDLWTCTSWQDLVDEAALRSWEDARQNMFLSLVKDSHVCRMRTSELPVVMFGETNEDISLMSATRQLRRADRETSIKVTVGQGNKRRTYSHARDMTTSLSALIAAATSLPGGKHRESSRHDIRENRRGPKWYTGDEGMVSWSEGIEGQGSHKASGCSGSHGLSGSPHDRHTRHSAATYRLGSRGSVPSLRVQSHVHSVNPKHSFLVPT
jgi:hypothetical protein